MAETTMQYTNNERKITLARPVVAAPCLSISLMHAPKSWNSASVGSKTFTPSHSRTFIPTQWCSPVCKLQTNVGWNSKITQSNATFHRHMDCTWPLTKWKKQTGNFLPRKPRVFTAWLCSRQYSWKQITNLYYNRLFIVLNPNNANCWNLSGLRDYGLYGSRACTHKQT